MFPLFEAMLRTPIIRVVERDKKTDYSRVIDIKYIPTVNVESYIKNYLAVIMRQFKDSSSNVEESESGYHNLLTLLISDNTKEFKITLENIDDQMNSKIKSIFDEMKLNKS